MIKIFVYAADQQLAEQTVQRLKEAGAEQAELLRSLNPPVRPPKDNRYLFICETPAEMLSALVHQVLTEEDYDQALTEWFGTQYQITQTVSAHRKRSILVTTSQLRATGGLISTVNTQWALNLPDVNKDAAIQQNPSQPEPLLGYLVQKLIEQTPPLQALENQINALAGINGEPLHEIYALTGYRAVRQQQTELITQNQHLAIETEELRKEKSDLASALDEQANATKEATEEAELLLLQLHQVQEELENYFLKNQGTEAKLAKQKARWNRLLKKHPDYIDTESIQIEVVDPTTQTLKWVVQGLEGQGITKDYLEFETFIESGILGIRFNKTNSHNEPNLKNWPASCEGESVDCIPAGKGNVMRQRALALRDLSASDWKLLNTLPHLIKQHHSDTALDVKLWGATTEAANKLTVGINALPKTFRYDAVTIKSKKVNPDYEHLWFELDNASYDTYYWPKFEFRLGAANIKPGKFSNHPKLEIPLINGKTKPFESWFEESYDEYGGKYELRFDLKRGIADKETLLKLEVKEQRVVMALASCLPALLDACRVNVLNVTQLSKNWTELASATSRLAI